jgi:hypothetical protein
MGALPLTVFKPLPEKESWIRNEKNVSKLVYFYTRFKELLGSEKAKDMFLDGAGEFIGARSWVPYYDDPQAYILYAGWIENRINNETVSLDEFSENKCVITFHDHIWRKLYHQTGHLRTMIDYIEYMELFEYIWRDRAGQSGWNIDFTYSESDTVMTFTK